MTAVDRNRRVIFVELNEVPLRVAQHFADRHPSSAMSQILAKGVRWDTFTPDEGHLSPWITWPTLHRGIAGSKHQLVALGQDHEDADREYPPVWSLLAGQGRRVGMFGSLHTYPIPKNAPYYAFYVPDTFAAGPETVPPELSTFQSFNLHMVDRSGRNVSRDLPVKEGLSFLARSLPAGIRPSTLAKIVRQLLSERLRRHRTARRRTIQSVLAFDLFLAQLRSTKPDAAFFFTNHVASSMHRYWPATFTEDYLATKWSDEWVRRFSGEIDYAMAEADAMLRHLIDFAEHNAEYVILVSGSMGQAAVDSADKQVTTQVLLRDMEKWLDQLGVPGAWQRRRTMEPTYTLAFDEKSSADAFMEAAAKVRVAGQELNARRLDEHGVEFVLGQYNIPDERLTLTIGNHSVAPVEAGLANVPIEDEVGAAAYHVPEGMLLAYDPRGWHGSRVAKGPVSTTRIAPTILAMQGVKRPDYMEPPLEELLVAELEVA